MPTRAMPVKGAVGGVVISGLAGRFPASNNVDEFKQNLFDGVDMVTESDARWPAGMWGLPTRNGIMPNIDKFDTEFFGIPEDEVNYIEPQERLMLEGAYEAIVDAGVDPVSLRGSLTGFYFGNCFQDTHAQFDDPQVAPAKIKSLVTRVSRYFQLRGPIIQTDTACGSSFTALNEAFLALKVGLVSSAIVVGTNTVFRPRVSLQFRDLTMIAMDGKSKCLDADANGYVRSEACVVLFLQRSEDAKRVYATILNSKSNADGFKVEGITFPSKAGQRTLVSEVYAEAGIDPVDIHYVEAHVTGTSAGDPVEMDAMYEVICPKKDPKVNPLYVGCLKSNMGHSEGASGLCALAKTLIIFQTGLIPPNLHFKSPNLRMQGLVDGKMVPVNRTIPFEGELIPVNCFGFGGANVHVLTKICNSRPVSSVKVTEPIPRLVQLCGRTPAAVNHLVTKLMDRSKNLMTNDFLSLLGDFSLMGHNSMMRYRAFVVVTDDPDSMGWYKFEATSPVLVGRRPLNLVFDAVSNCSLAFDQLMELPIFAASARSLNSFLVKRGVDLLAKGSSFDESRQMRTLRSVVTQMAIFDVLTVLNVQFDGFFAFAEGHVAAAYARGLLSDEKAVAAAFELSKATDQIDLQSRLFKMFGDAAKNAQSPPAEALNIQVGQFALFEHDSSDQEPIVSFVKALGRMYTNGSSPAVSKMYPAVSYPMPSQTPSLSSLLQWKHDVTLPLAPFLIQNTSYHFAFSRSLKFHFDRRTPEDTFFYDHKIDGRTLFPATGYLMMAWRAFAKLNNVTPFDFPVEFLDISFERATVMSPTETNLSLRINEDSGYFIIKEADNHVVTGTIRMVKRPYEEDKSGGIGKPRDSDVVDLDAKDIYKEFRIRGYDYGQYFQGLDSAASDGRTGQLVWRDVLQKSFKDSLSLDTDEERALLWLRSWTTFTDAMFQLLLMSKQDTTRNLFVPRRLLSVVCYPEVLRKNIHESPRIMDPLTLNEASYVTAMADPSENSVSVAGLVIKGLQTSLLRRRQQFARLKRYYFAPSVESVTLDTCEDMRLVEDYYEDVLSCARRLNKGRTEVDFKTHFDLGEDRHALLRVLLNKVRGHQDTAVVSLDKDLLVGKMEEDWYYQEHLLKPHLEQLIYDSVSEESIKVNVLEYATSKHVLSKTLLALNEESLLCDATTIKYTLLHPNPSVLESSYTSQVNEVLDMGITGVEDAPMSNLVVYRSDSDPNVLDLFGKFYKRTHDAGFLLVLTKERLDNADLDKALEGLGLQQNYSTELNVLKDAAFKAGYHFISQKTLFGAIIPLHAVLFKKQELILKVDKQIVQEIGVDNYHEWHPVVKEHMKSLQDDPEARLWLTPRMADATNHGITGVLGFVKSLRFEAGGSKVRCLVDWASNGKPDLGDPKYADILKKDLAFNLYGGDKAGWGSYEHGSLPRDIQADQALLKASEHVYLKALKPGDLSSFAWVQNDMGRVSSANMAHVYYAPLNFRDIMFASGRLQAEAIPGIPADVAQDSILGLEFSGRDVNGNRVMGVVPYKALATSVELKDHDLIWPVPNGWSLEEAATVPCVYATAYYALCVRGNLVKDESVLVHAGAGGVGLAAINVCLSYGCKVFTTVGSQKKRDFLLKEFPQLEDKDIFYSRDTTFEDDLRRATNGRGVDVILNSLAEDKLQAGLRCLAPNGRFLEIGKVDFISDNKLFQWQVDENRTFHGILLDSLFRYNNDDYFPQRLMDEKKHLKALVMQGIRDGTVRPLTRSVFSKDQVEEAFRFMSAGKHIGKVIIQVREEDASAPLAIPALKVTYMSPSKSYIVLGGLGGFGLEVVMWLADKGARRVVVGARRGIREPYQQFSINRLRKRGVQVVISQASAATEAGARALIEAAMELGPVGGIFNTAVHYDDVLFEEMSVEQFAATMEPKLEASLHLDRLSRRLCPHLEHFVTFSSISCGRGNQGQTNYNFANAAMDSICEKRVSDGLPGLSIQWGVVGDVGIVSEKSRSTEVNLLGATSQRLHSLLSALDRFLVSGFPVALSYVKAEKAGNTSEDLDSVDLLKMVSRIFGLKDISALDPLATLGDLGIDSLIAVEMKQLLERVTGANMSVKEIREIKIATLVELSEASSKATKAKS